MTHTSTTGPVSTTSGYRWLALAVAVFLIVGAGALYGRYSQRWGQPPDLVAAGTRLEQLPRQIGDWKSAEDLPMEKSAVAMLECAGYVNRRYTNQETGQSISLAIIVGPPGPIAVHTPEICFSSRAYDIQTERKEVSMAANPAQQDTFWSVDFKSRNALAVGLRVYYAWSLSGVWEAATSPRYEFAASPLLYKIQLAAPLAPRLGDASSDPGREFLVELSKSGWKCAAN